MKHPTGGNAPKRTKRPAAIPVAVVARDLVDRSGYTHMLQTIGGYDVVLSVADGHALIDACRTGKAFEVVLVDVQGLAPGAEHMTAHRLLQWLHTELPDVYAVATGGVLLDPDTLYRAFSNYAGAVLLRGVDHADLALALQDRGPTRVHRNRVMQRLFRGGLAELERKRRKQPPPPLTPGQTKALVWWVDPHGWTKTQIAHKQNVEVSTVCSHLKAAYQRLGVHTRMEAQRYAHHHHLV